MAAVNKQCDLQSEGDKLFDHVVFCTNVTYADGGFKSGQCLVFERWRYRPSGC